MTAGHPQQNVKVREYARRSPVGNDVFAAAVRAFRRLPGGRRMVYPDDVAGDDETGKTLEYSGRRLEFETLISDLSSGFINLPPGEMGREIEEALRRVCEFLGIDYAVLWQWSFAGGDVPTATHAYPAQGDVRHLAPLRQDQYPWAVQQVRAGRMVVVPSLEAMPVEADVDRESARIRGIKSNLTVPLSVGGTSPIGALAFNSTRAERDWPDALVNRLRLIAQVFANALARQRADEALRESEERLSLAADSAEAGLWVLDYATGTFWVTQWTRTIFGFSPDEVITMERLEASVHPDDWNLVRAAIEHSASSGEPARAEYRIRQREGGVRWVSSRGRPHFTSTGEPDRLMGVSIDVTGRRSGEEALLASQARLEAGADLGGLAFYEVDFVEGVTFFDDRFRDLFGIPSDREQGLQPLEFWIEHLHPDDRERVMDLRRQLHDGRRDRFSLEYRFLHPDLGEKWIHHLAGAAARGPAGRAVRTYGVLRDITERKRAENEMHDLSRRLIQAQEEERSFLARELHDDMSQRLAVLAIDVGRAELAATDGAQAEAMRTVREGLVRLSEDVHSLAYRLHPSILEELGLAEALRAECERRGRQASLDLSVCVDLPAAVIDRDAALCLFRIAQEALSNVVRHAGATVASVKLRQMDDGLALSVSDNGIGFEVRHPGPAARLGLVGMRERAQLVAGTLDIQSAPGEGTTVVAWVPVDGTSG